MPTRWALIGVVSMSVCVPLAVASCGTTQEAGTGQGGDSGNGATGDGSADSTAQDGNGGSVHDTGRADRARSDSASDDDSGDDRMPDDAGDGDAPTETPDAPACVPGCPTGVTCGVWKDCSGATIVCGEPCTTGHVCLLTSHSPAAQSCQPTPACAGKCGVVNQDACGVGVSCGGCTGGNSCVNNACVPPTGGDGLCAGQRPEPLRYGQQHVRRQHLLRLPRRREVHRRCLWLAPARVQPGGRRCGRRFEMWLRGERLRERYDRVRGRLYGRHEVREQRVHDVRGAYLRRRDMRVRKQRMRPFCELRPELRARRLLRRAVLRSVDVLRSRRLRTGQPRMRSHEVLQPVCNRGRVRQRLRHLLEVRP
jgi:hypothetical protein